MACRSERGIMSSGEPQSHVRQTSLLLRELLLSRPGYRQLWQEQAERRRSAAISKAGVARVIALHLRGTGARASGTSTLPHRDLKDRIRRALAGESLTPQTLAWFVAAFEMDERDERVLWASYAGDHEGNAGISHTITTNRELALPQRHRTTALFERYAITADRRVAVRRTLQTIMAIEDGVDTYPCVHEPAIERCDVIYGGTLGRHYVHGDGLHTAAIMLERKLLNGETASLEYHSYYPGGYPAAEVRRLAHGRSENVDIAVQFDQSALPRQVAWAVWPDYLDGSPVAEQPVSLDAYGSAHRFVRFIKETVVGFRWEW
jgi:hypothetical protein